MKKFTDKIFHHGQNTQQTGIQDPNAPYYANNAPINQGINPGLNQGLNQGQPGFNQGFNQGQPGFNQGLGTQQTGVLPTVVETHVRYVLFHCLSAVSSVLFSVFSFSESQHSFCLCYADPRSLSRPFVLRR